MAAELVLPQTRSAVLDADVVRVLLVTSWLVLSLAQGYYSMMLFPFLMTVVLPNSVLRNWPAWLAATDS